MNTMPDKLLSISIPTFNRWEYLSDLLPNLLEQSREVDPDGHKIEIIINDNASTDGTANGIFAIEKTRLRYFRNDTNIGGDANFIECVKRASAKYVWIFGDDDIIVDGGIKRLFYVLQNLSPCLVITISMLPQSSHYLDYRNLLIDALKFDPLFPVHHTLITSNVFEKSLFDITTALQAIPTNYGHMYALLENLRVGRVYCFGNIERVIAVREARAPFALNPLNLTTKLIAYQSKVASTFSVPYLAFYVRLFYLVLNRRYFKRIDRIVSWPWNFARRIISKVRRIVFGYLASLNFTKNRRADEMGTKKAKM